MRPKHYVGLFLFAVVGLSATGMLSNLFGGASSAQDAPQQKAPNPFALPPLSPPVLEMPPQRKVEPPPVVQPESPLPPPILPVGAKQEVEKKPAPVPQQDELLPLVPPPPPIPGLEEKKEPKATTEPQSEVKPAPLPPIPVEEKLEAKPAKQPEVKPAPLPPIPVEEKLEAKPAKQPEPQPAPLAPIPLEEKPVASPPEPKKDSLPPLPGLEPKGPSSIDAVPPPPPPSGLVPKGPSSIEVAPPPAPPVKSSLPEPKKELLQPLSPSVPSPAPKIDEPVAPLPMPSLTPAPQPMSTPPSPPQPAPTLNPPPIVSEPKSGSVSPPNQAGPSNTPSQPPANNQVVKTKGSPWTLLVAMTDEGATVTATINNKYAFQIKCQNAELMSAKGTFEATGKVTFQSEGFEGQCDRFSIALADDRVVLEGGAEVRLQTKGTRRFNSGGSEEPAPQVEMKGQRLDLRVSDLMQKATRSGGSVGSAVFPGEIQLVSGSRVRMAATILPDRQWSDVGTLRATDLQHDGQPVWSLVNDQGRTLLHLTTRAGRSLQTFEGRVIALGGSYVENAPMGTLMIATEIMIP